MENPDNKGPYAGMNALSELRDIAIFLSLGNEYLCLDPILIKIGRSIDLKVEKAREEISALKKKFPGKYSPEINTNNILAEMQRTARGLQKPTEDLKERCRVGTIGKDLEDKTKELAEAIGEIRLKIGGKRPSYSPLEIIFKPFRRLGEFKRPLGGIFSWVFRLTFVLLGFCLLGGVYLYLSLEKEPDLLKKIAASESVIESKRAVISDLDVKRNDIIHMVADLEKKELLRQDKIAIIDLEMKLHEINDEKIKIQSEVRLLLDSIQENKKKIEEIKNKTYWKRILESVLDHS